MPPWMSGLVAGVVIGVIYGVGYAHGAWRTGQDALRAMDLMSRQATEETRQAMLAAARRATGRVGTWRDSILEPVTDAIGRPGRGRR